MFFKLFKPACECDASSFGVRNSSFNSSPITLDLEGIHELGLHLHIWLTMAALRGFALLLYSPPLHHANLHNLSSVTLISGICAEDRQEIPFLTNSSFLNISSFQQNLMTMTKLYVKIS